MTDQRHSPDGGDTIDAYDSEWWKNRDVGLKAVDTIRTVILNARYVDRIIAELDKAGLAIVNKDSRLAAAERAPVTRGDSVGLSYQEGLRLISLIDSGEFPYQANADDRLATERAIKALRTRSWAALREAQADHRAALPTPTETTDAEGDANAVHAAQEGQ